MMPIVCQCPTCQARFKVDARYAGKKARCPKCQQIAPVPGSEAVPTAPVMPPPPPTGAPAARPRISAPPPINSIPLPPAQLPPFPRTSAAAAIEEPPAPTEPPPAEQPPAEPAAMADFSPAADCPIEVVTAFQVNVGARPLHGKSSAEAPLGKRPSSSALPIVLASCVGLLFLAGAGLGGAWYVGWFGGLTGGSLTGGNTVADANAPHTPDAKVTTGTLLLDWSEADRSGAALTLNGRSEPIGRTGELKFVLAPGTHTVLIRRRGFDAFEAQVEILQGVTKRVTPEWKPAVGYAALPAGAPPSAAVATTPSAPPPAISGAAMPQAGPAGPLQYISDQFVGATVVHPQRILQSKAAAEAGLAAMLVQWAEQYIDPALIQELVVLVTDPAAGGRVPAAVVRFTQPVEGRLLIDQIFQPTQERNESGLTIFVTPDGQVGGFQPDPTTLVVGPPALLSGMAAAQGVASPLIERLRAADLTQDVAGVFVMTGAMQSLAAQFAATVMTAPPGGTAPPADVLAAADGLANKIAAANFSINAASDQMRLVVSTTDAQAAANLKTVGQYLLGPARDQVVGRLETDFLPEQLHSIAKRSITVAAASLKLEAVGSELIGSSAGISAAAPTSAPPAAAPATPSAP